MPESINFNEREIENFGQELKIFQESIKKELEGSHSHTKSVHERADNLKKLLEGNKEITLKLKELKAKKDKPKDVAAIKGTAVDIKTLKKIVKSLLEIMYQPSVLRLFSEATATSVFNQAIREFNNLDLVLDDLDKERGGKVAKVKNEGLEA